MSTTESQRASHDSSQDDPLERLIASMDDLAGHADTLFMGSSGDTVTGFREGSRKKVNESFNFAAQLTLQELQIKEGLRYARGHRGDPAPYTPPKKAK